MFISATSLFAQASREGSHEGMMVSDYYFSCYHYFFDHNLTKANQYVKSCIKEAAELKNDRYLLQGLMIDMMVNVNYYRPFDAVDELAKASELATKLKDQRYQTLTENIIGDVFTLLHDFSKANTYYQGCKQEFEKSHYPADYIYHKCLFDYIFACIKLGKYDILDSSVNLGMMKFDGDPLVLEYRVLKNILALFKRLQYVERKITDDIYKLMFEIEDLQNEYDRFRILTLLYPLVDSTEDYQLFKEYTDLLDAYSRNFEDVDIEDTIKLIKVNLLGVDEGNMEYIEFIEKKNKLIIESLDKAINKILALNNATYELDGEIRKNADLEKQNQTDELTRLMTRRYGVSMVEAALADVTKKSYAMIMLDVDDFKKINDTYGHGAGDQALIHLSKTLRDVFDEDAYIIRLAGDEFIIFLYNLPTDYKIRRSVVLYNLDSIIKHFDKTRLDFIGGHYMGISMGVVFDEGNFEELYSKADTALYGSKYGGKGTYSVFGEDEDDEDVADDDDDDDGIVETTVVKKPIKPKGIVIDTPATEDSEDDEPDEAEESDEDDDVDDEEEES